MANITPHELQYSVIEHLRNKTNLNVDWIYDGYKMREGETFMSVKEMQSNYEYIVKLRESVNVINRFQVGLHATSESERSRKQDEIRRLLTFDRIPYIDTEVSSDKVCGYLDVYLRNVTPMSSSHITDKSSHHTVYFDIEIDTIIRR